MPLFLIIPLIEIAIFLEASAEIGLLNTLILCFVTAVIGSALVRWQGMEIFLAARQSLAENKIPIHEIFDGICIFAAGLVLITPGFFTDVIGFTLLMPPARALLKKIIVKTMNISIEGLHDRAGTPYNTGQSNDDAVIEAKFETLNEKELKDDEQKNR